MLKFLFLTNVQIIFVIQRLTTISITPTATFHVRQFAELALLQTPLCRTIRLRLRTHQTSELALHQPFRSEIACRLKGRKEVLKHSEAPEPSSFYRVQTQ